MTAGTRAHRETESPTQCLSRFVAEASSDAIPPKVFEAARAHLLDTIGCIIGGIEATPSRVVMDLFAEAGGAGEATVLGAGTRLPVAQAAYVNAYLANVLDFDDSYVRLGHPGAVVVPAALAAAERAGASGRDLLLAVILGYEVCLRIGAAIMPTPGRYRQVWGLATWQVFGAVAAAARLLGLDVEQTRHAFGLGGISAPVPFIHKFGHDARERPFSWAKNHYGWAVMGAVTACLLAQRGFIANPAILDGEHGFWVMAGSDRCDFAAMTAGLGEEYRLPTTGFKPYACCRWTHTALDVVRRLREGTSMDPAAIARIEIHTFGELVEKFGGPAPRSLIDAQFHLPYLVALTCLDRAPTRALSEGDLTDEAVLALMSRVTLHLDPDADRAFFERRRLPVRVVVTGRDGSRREASADAPPGAPDGPPFTLEDLRVKFSALVEPIIGREQTQRLEAVALSLEAYDVTDLVRLASRPVARLEGGAGPGFRLS